jgi:DNA-binding transcriptional MerR regulator
MRDSGLSIESLAEYTKLYQKGDETLEARQAILIVEYKKLLEKQQQINETVFKLGNKIKNYEAKIKTGESQTASYANGSVE